MYPVDENFETCLNSKSRYDILYGTVDLAGGMSIDLTMKDIKENSVSITWDASDGSQDITFGTCICAELDITLYTDYDRYALNNCVITLVYRVFDKMPEYDENDQITNEAIYSDCPLGIFTAMDVTKDSHANTAHILAYDHIKKLDVTCGNNVFSGIPYIVLNYVHTKSGIGFDLVQSDLDIYPNHTSVVQYDATTGSKTYRDIVRYTGQLMGTNFRVNRETGSLDIWRYDTSPVLSLGVHDRYDHTPSDYLVKYKGIEVTSVKGTYKSIDNNMLGAKIMYIDDAPAWDYGLPNDLRDRATAIGNYVRSIEYTPCSINVFNDPRYECGDMIAVAVDDNTDHDIHVLVTTVNWSFRGKGSLTSVGTSPETSTGVIKDSERKATRSSTANKLVSYDVTNTDAITLNDQESLIICDVNFTSAQATHAMWLANILLESDGDSGDYTDVKITYYYDDAELTFYPTEHYVDGNHDFSLFFPISAVSENAVHNWKVEITSLGGSITIDTHDFRGTLFGQNLVEEGERWDGLLQLEDLIPYITPITVTSNLVESNVSVTTYIPANPDLSDLVQYLAMVNNLIGVTDGCTIKFGYREDICFCGENYYCGTEGVLL